MKIITFLSTLLLSYSTVYSSKTVLFKESINNNTKHTSFFDNSIGKKKRESSPLILSNTPKKKSLFIGFKGSYSISSIFNNAIYKNSIWEFSPGIELSYSFETYYMFTNNYGIGTGIKPNTYSLTLSIKDFSKQLSTYVTDIDGDNYFPIIEIQLLEEYNYINTIDIPLFAKLNYGMFFIDIGPIFTFVNKSSYTLKGSATTRGYYPDYDVILANFPEYGLTTSEYNSETFSFSVPKFILSGYTSIGMIFSLGNYVSLKVNANAVYGITDLNYNMPKHDYDFYRTTETKGDKTNLISTGLEVGMVVKLFQKK